MTANDSSVETIDMGSFDFSGGERQESNKQQQTFSFNQFDPSNKQGTGRSKEDPYVKQAIKSITSKPRKTDEQVKEHQELVLILSRYGQSKRFSEHLKTMGFNLSITHLKKCETQELEEILARVRVCIDNKNVSNLFEDTAFGAIQTGEAFVVNTKLGQKVKLQGLTELLRNDDNLLDLLEQIQLENQDMVHTSPYIRLVYSIVSSAMKVHAVNTMIEKRLKIIKPTTQEPEDKSQEPEDKTQEGSRSAQERSRSAQESEEKTQEKEDILSFEGI